MKVPLLSWSTRTGRARLIQAALLAALALALAFLWRNTRQNLTSGQIRTGFGFLHEPAGFDVGEGLVRYTPSDTYLLAFAAGVANTLRVAVAGIVLATVLGTLVGLGRLSRNALVRWLCTGYVEVLRNVPLVIQLFAWYLVATEILPEAASPIRLAPHVYLSKGGLQFPHPVWARGWAWSLACVPPGLAAAWGLLRWGRARRERTGHAPRLHWAAALLALAFPLAGWLAGGAPRALELPEVTHFNVSGGVSLTPEFLALLVGLSTFTAAFIAEIVRSGVLAVPRGQGEAAAALGLSPRQATRLVLLPQALRIIVPPLTSQFLNLTKNSSLAVAIGYPDIVSIANTGINQNGQALECIAVIMSVYLGINLLTALGMAWYNRRVALVEG
ncbi:MAG TPA: ABC transporter permease subunit [Anaeromyxobacteraceae bacterium]|nr:ABC transporter permease subunit [Anaeromyxobacteraceae bacterium]